uniref:Uncharacterized protein n=1 Tax=viral metagenome TaxID=1070528 RepID=A0A6C0H7J9_9ZZZZ
MNGTFINIYIIWRAVFIYNNTYFIAIFRKIIKYFNLRFKLISYFFQKFYNFSENNNN